MNIWPKVLVNLVYFWTNKNGYKKTRGTQFGLKDIVVVYYFNTTKNNWFNICSHILLEER